jgi:hypothetical protein
MYFYQNLKKKHMTFALLLVGIIFGGIMAIISVIFSIISLANSRSNKAIGWGAGFLVSLAVLIICIVQMVHKVANKVKQSVEWAQTHENRNYSYNAEMLKSDRQEWLDSLQMHGIAKYEGKVPADFYVNTTVVKDGNGIRIVPFLYPFQFRYNSNTGTGDIVMGGEDSVFVQNVSQIAFDENFALIKCDNSQSSELLKSGKPETEYLLFDLRTRNSETVPNMEKLIDLGNRIGYVGPTSLRYLSDALRGYVEEETYD